MERLIMKTINKKYSLIIATALAMLACAPLHGMRSTPAGFFAIIDYIHGWWYKRTTPDLKEFNFVRENGDYIGTVSLEQAKKFTSFCRIINSRENPETSALFSWKHKSHYWEIDDDIPTKTALPIIRFIQNYGSNKEKASVEDAKEIMLSNNALNFYLLANKLVIKPLLKVCDTNIIQNKYFKELFGNDQQKKLGIDQLSFEEKLDRLTFGRADDIVEQLKHNPAYWVAFTHNPLQNRINYIAWSPDGTKLAFAFSDGTCKVYNFTTQQLSTLITHNDRVHYVAWSPDGTMLASSARDGTIKVYNFRTQQTITIGRIRTAGVDSIAWSPDGTMLAFSSNNDRCNVYNFHTQQITTLINLARGIELIAWSPDGTMLAFTTDDNTCNVYNFHTQQITTLYQITWRIRHIAWHPNSTMLASASDDRTCMVYDFTTQQLTTPITHTSKINCVAWSPDGTMLASASHDCSCKVYDFNTRQIISTFDDNTNTIKCVAWSPNGTMLASGSHDGICKVYDFTTQQKSIPITQTNEIYIAWNRDGTKLASVSCDGICKVAQAGSSKNILKQLEKELTTV